MTYNLKATNAIYGLILFYWPFVRHSYVICMCLYITRMSMQFNIVLDVIRMLFAHARMWLVWQSYVTCMSYVCHSYVLAFHPYAIRMSLVCTRMSQVCRLYILVRHSYVTRMSLVCSFTMNLLRLGWPELGYI